MTEITQAAASSRTSRAAFRAAPLLKAAGLAIVAAVVANELVLLVAHQIFTIDPAFEPLGPAAPAIVTTFFLVIGTILALVVARFAGNPARTYWIVAVVGLVVSYLPNLNLAVTGHSQYPGATPAAQLTLAVMHLVAFLVAVPLLVRGIVASRPA